MAVLDVVKKMSGSIIGPQQMTEATQEVEFTFPAPEARKVCSAGKFNAWDTGSTPMKKGKDGTWRIKLKLPPGTYEYRYFVDGAWASDQKCPEVVPNPFGTNNCVISSIDRRSPPGEITGSTTGGTQRRQDGRNPGGADLVRDLDLLFSAPADDVFMVKLAWWIGRDQTHEDDFYPGWPIVALCPAAWLDLMALSRHRRPAYPEGRG